MIPTRRLAIVMVVGTAGLLAGSAGPCAEDCTTITQSAGVSSSSSERVGLSPLAVGDTVTVFFLTCTCMLCHTTGATWRSVDPEVATVTGRGSQALVTAVGVGSTTIQAESTGEIDGRVWKRDATVVVAGSRQLSGAGRAMSFATLPGVR